MELKSINSSYSKRVESHYLSRRFLPFGCLFSFIFLWCISGVSSASISSIHTDQCKSRSCYPATGNLLIGRERQLFSTSTCGLRYPEPYCIVSHLEDRKKCFICDSTFEWLPHINEKSHRIENIIHDNLKQRPKKWWQSQNGVQNVSIQLNLEAEFHFTHLIMTFKSFRPAAMFVERSSDFGKNWKIYRYFAYDCAESFPGILEASTPRKHSDVVCDSRYSNVAPSTNGEVVFKVLSPHIRTSDPFAPEIQDLLRVTNLRINFTKLHTLGDNLLDNRPDVSEKYYYAIYDMIVRGSCSCYGHAEHCIPTEGDGVSFAPHSRRIDMVHGRCQCTHNTKGMNCEECEDFYNDLPWRPAVDREINACKRCECNNHAARCHFDRGVYEQSGFVSGGVCDDCQHNTMGKNCEQCKPYFFREPNRGIDDPYVCRACECDLRGSLNQGICDSKTDPDEGLEAGKCRCKTHIDGERCDRCKHGYWRMEQDNPDGCTPCTCYLLGTYGNEGCDKISGKCTCKRLVTGENCDRCLPEHWGLSEDANGCKICDCDLGGAIDNSCDTATGQCRCRPHFTGRRCDQPESGYFCVALDYYTYEAEDAILSTAATIELREPVAFETNRQMWTGNGFAKIREGGTIEINIDNINVAMNFHVVLRFESQLTSVWQNVDIALIRPESPNPNGPCREYMPKDDFMKAVLYPGGRYYEIPQPVCLEPRVQYKLKISLGDYQTGFSNRSASVLIDSVVLVPATTALSIFSDGTVSADYRRREFEQYQCRYAILDLTPSDRLSDVCKRYACPLAAAITNQGIECNCDPTGSVSGICSPTGGQCQCKPMVVGRRCERCAPGTFGFGPQGCTACECNSVGSLDNFCDIRTGQCKCREGVYGRQCDQCQPGYWGFPNCRQCQCNGHADICDQDTGACIECRDLTTSHYCDRCQDGYYGDPRIGVNIACRPCPCPGGPASGFQHADTCYLDPPTQNVACNCRQGYIGERCDKCSINYWGNPNEVGGSCERCDCHNNIDFNVAESCDVKTGRCTKCLYNTEGFQCEHCVAGYFGDAKIQSCQRCICNSLGTDHNAGPCDRANGQCPCLPNVIGVQCDTCAKNHWKIASATGCENCDCDPTGVTLDSDGQPQLQCNEFDGQCPCKVGRGGRNCGECENYYWGDPATECKRCECNRIGSATLQCHRENGTCVCLPGSGGSNCDECARGYTGTWPHCQPCGECFQNWDKILMKLKEETMKLVEQAGNIESTGVASVYDSEFQAMETKLVDVQKQLNTANISKQEVDFLNDRIKSIENLLDTVRSRLGAVDNRVTENAATVDASEARLKSLREQVGKLASDAAEYDQNATKLRESDVEGAYNTTKEASDASKEAKQRADDTERVIAESDSIRRRTSEKLETFENDFNKQFQQNQATLDDLSVSVNQLNKKIPPLNTMVCGAAGDPCDDLCGGAGCGKCGGPSCGDGAITKSEQAFAYSKEANDKLTIKQKEANELLNRIRSAQSDSEKALIDARGAYETAVRVAQQANDTRQTLQSQLDQINAFLNGKGATPAEIRTLAQEIMNMTISDDPTKIEQLGQQISENLGKLTNIDAILDETRNNLTQAQQLKQRADEAKTRAETVLNTTQAVIEALNKAKGAQDKAQEAIDKANEDIDSARKDLGTIADETALAEAAANDSSQALATLKGDFDKVEIDYLQIDKDVARARNVTNAAKSKAGLAEEKRKTLESRHQQAQNILNEKLGEGHSSTPMDRAERLRQKATGLLEKSQKHQSEIDQQRKDFDNNEHRVDGAQQRLTELHQRMDDATKAISNQLDYYEKCN